MADPVSIVGTAVGVTSLGIQACQAIIQYYSGFRSFDEDIDAVTKRAEGLEGSLEALESLRPKVEVRDDHVSKQLQHAIEACASGLVALKEMALKCGETNVPVSVVEKKRFLKKKLLWPFRQETLTKLRTALDELQANVQLALQVLEIDTGRHHFDALRSNTDTLVVRSARIEQGLHTQTHGLNTILHHIEQGQGHEASHFLQLSLQLASIERKLGHAIAPASFVTVGDHQPSVSQCSVAETVAPSDNLEQLSRPNKRNKKKIWCNCRNREDVLWWKKIGDSLEVGCYQETEHRPHCSLARRGNSSYKIQAKFTHFTQLLGVCIRAGIAYAKVSGWTSVQPSLSIQAIVPDDSPVFVAIWNVVKRCHHSRCTCLEDKKALHCECDFTKEAPLLLHDLPSQILQMFEEGIASPHDVVSYYSSSTMQRGIFYEASYAVFYMIARGSLDVPTACNFLGKLISFGISDDGLTESISWFDAALVWMPHLKDETIKQMASVVSYLISEFGSVSVPLRYEITSPTILHLLSDILTSHKDVDIYGTHSCPLFEALHRRSGTDFVREIHAHQERECTASDPGDNRQCFHGFDDLFWVLMHWPEGLRIFLSSQLHESDTDIENWDMVYHASFRHGVAGAVEIGNLESLNILSRAGYPVYPSAWFSACLLAPSLCRELITDMVKWKSSTPRGRLPYDWETDISYIWDPSSTNLYHTAHLSLESAKCLWEAGFTSVDVTAAYYNWKHSNPLLTPLWIQSSRLFYEDNDWFFQPRWDLMEWFVEKGAKLDWIHPTLCTTPAHMIALTIASQYLGPPFFSKDCIIHGTTQVRLIEECMEYRFPKKRSEVSFVERVFSLEHLDQCCCYCSEGGCRVIACAAKLSCKSFPVDSPLKCEQRFMLRIISKIVDSRLPYSKSMGLAVIRILTFEEMNLTHTCCLVFQPSGDQEDDLQNIRYVESREIKAFQHLMAEFTRTWMEYAGMFSKFLERVWRPRMQETYEQESIGVDSVQIQHIKETGVNLWATVGPRTAQCDCPLEDNRWRAHGPAKFKPGCRLHPPANANPIKTM